MPTRTAAEMLALYEDAIAKVLAGQSYSMGGRTLTRANLGELQEGQQYWARRAARASNGGVKIRRGVFSPR